MAPHIDWSRKVDVKYDCDVAVVGGGIAGVSAACAAAKSGARVVLVERFAVTGGNATTGGVAAFCGETAGQGEVFDEIIRELQAFDAVEPYTPYPEADHRCFDHEILAVLLQEMLLRRGVTLLLHTRFVDAVIADGRVTELILCGKSGPEALVAKQFVDCTGEAELARATAKEVRTTAGVRLPGMVRVASCWMEGSTVLSTAEVTLYLSSRGGCLPTSWLRGVSPVAIQSTWLEAPS